MPSMIPKIPADISIPGPVLGITSIIALLLGCLFIILACSCIRAHRPGRSGLYGLVSILCFSATAVGLLITLNIHTYQRLNHESRVAEIHFSRLGSQIYTADIYFEEEQDSQQFEIRGDEWQLSARIIKWKTALTMIGFNSLYRLDRIQGRYRDLEQERNAPRSVYSLNPDRRLDLWSIIQQYRNWLPWFDAFYGSATYLPMTDKSSFQIKITRSGLIAIPLNEAASEAIGKWRR